jgi:hypothetical protein
MSRVPIFQKVSGARPTTPALRSPRCRSINRLLPSGNDSTSNGPGGAQGTVGRLPIHDECSPRFDAADLPELTGKFAEVTLRSHPDPIPGVQGLQPWIEVVKVVDVCAEDSLDPRVGVEPGPATPNLYEPGRSSVHITTLRLSRRSTASTSAGSGNTQRRLSTT